MLTASTGKMLVICFESKIAASHHQPAGQNQSMELDVHHADSADPTKTKKSAISCLGPYASALILVNQSINDDWVQTKTISTL